MGTVVEQLEQLEQIAALEAQIEHLKVRQERMVDINKVLVENWSCRSLMRRMNRTIVAGVRPSLVKMRSS